MRYVSYSLKEPAPDKQVNTIVDRLVMVHDAALMNPKREKSMKTNLSKNEADGLKWLKDMPSKGEISVVQADKGGGFF